MGGDRPGRRGRAGGRAGLLASDLPSRWRTLNETFLALALLLPYLQLRRPLPRALPSGIAVVLLVVVVAFESTAAVTDLAETFGILILAPVAFDLVDRGILDPQPAARTRWLWYAWRCVGCRCWIPDRRRRAAGAVRYGVRTRRSSACCWSSLPVALDRARTAAAGVPAGRDVGHTRGVHISARTDYALRALLALAGSGSATVPGPVLAAEQELPLKFLEAILADLRRAGLVRTRRGPVGGYALARSAELITVGEVVRAVDGPLAVVRGERPEQAAYEGAAEHLQELWIALRAALRIVLDEVTLAELLSGELPARVRDLVAEPGAWKSR